MSHGTLWVTATTTSDNTTSGSGYMRVSYQPFYEPRPPEKSSEPAKATNPEEQWLRGRVDEICERAFA